MGIMRRHWIATLFAAITFSLTVPAIAAAQNKPSAQTQLEEARRLEQQVGDLFEANKYDDAIKLANRALAIREKWLPPDHPDIAESLNDIGVLYQQKGGFAPAKPLLVRALAIREKALKPNDPLIIETLINLAAAY